MKIYKSSSRCDVVLYVTSDTETRVYSLVGYQPYQLVHT